MEYIRSPSSQAEFTAYQAFATAYAESCIKFSVPKGIVAHVSTRETVQDWNSLRRALGYDKMHFMSYS
jgi:hypothetical protein